MDEKPKIRSIDYPSNAHGENKERKIEKVVTGKVTVKKKTLGEKIKENVFGEDIKDVSSYIFWDTLIPALKNTIVDAVTGGIEMFFFGEKRSSRSSRDRNKTYVSYNSIYDKRPGRREEPSRRRETGSFDDLVFESYAEAETVLNHLVDLVEEYDMVSVADFYDLVGKQGNFTDNKYGWVNLGGVKVIRVRNGYIIDLPRPVLLD